MLAAYLWPENQLLISFWIGGTLYSGLSNYLTQEEVFEAIHEINPRRDWHIMSVTLLDEASAQAWMAQRDIINRGSLLILGE